MQLAAACLVGSPTITVSISELLLTANDCAFQVLLLLAHLFRLPLPLPHALQGPRRRNLRLIHRILSVRLLEYQ